MPDYLMREAAPLGDETWAKIDEMVVTVVKKALVGRRLLHLKALGGVDRCHVRV